MRSIDKSKRRDNMALIFQDAFTIAVRVRAGRQVVRDPDIFRSYLVNALATAELDGARAGYQAEDLRLGSFAVAAFLDESILECGARAFHGWENKTLLEEMFGVTRGGEKFFRNVERLLARADSKTAGDLLEVHQLCLLLGFRGHLQANEAVSGGVSQPAARDLVSARILKQIEVKMRSIRGEPQALAWRPPLQTVPPSCDPWIPALRWVTLGCSVAAMLLFLFFQLSLHWEIKELTRLAQELTL